VSVCLSVTSRSTKTAERIELIFGMWASFHPSYTVLKENLVISKNKATFLWNFVLKSGLRKFRHGISIVETCYQLSSSSSKLKRNIYPSLEAECMVARSTFGFCYSSSTKQGIPERFAVYNTRAQMLLNWQDSLACVIWFPNGRVVNLWNRPFFRSFVKMTKSNWGIEKSL